jgi:hypothetical protein
VHAGVGTSGGDDADGMAGDLADRVLERVLDSAMRRLRLETAERAARVLESQSNTHGAFRDQRSGIRDQIKARAPMPRTGALV